MKFSIVTFFFSLLLLTGKAQRSAPDIIQTGKGALTIQPIVHASLVLSINGLTIYADPSGGAANYMGLPSPNLILITDIHGDHFDLVVTQARWLAHLGDHAYTIAIVVNRIFNDLRRRLGFGYWSLSQWAKRKVKNAVNYIGEFEKTLVLEAKRSGTDGVICGHIHHAAIHDDFGVTYINCGDWVESCTAIAEHPDGRFEIITWTTMSTHEGTEEEIERDVEAVHAA